jgi:hypothetical protein
VSQAVPVSQAMLDSQVLQYLGWQGMLATVRATFPQVRKWKRHRGARPPASSSPVSLCAGQAHLDQRARERPRGFRLRRPSPRCAHEGGGSTRHGLCVFHCVPASLRCGGAAWPGGACVFLTPRVNAHTHALASCCVVCRLMRLNPGLCTSVRRVTYRGCTLGR